MKGLTNRRLAKAVRDGAHNEDNENPARRDRVQLACDIRIRQPRIGSRKLYHLLRNDFELPDFKLGRDCEVHKDAGGKLPIHYCNYFTLWGSGSAVDVMVGGKAVACSILPIQNSMNANYLTLKKC